MRVKGAWKSRENKKDEKIRVSSGKKDRWGIRDIPIPRDLNLCSSLLSVWTRCVKNSSESCCLIVENSACPLPMTFLNITGLMPSWNSGFCVVMELALAWVLGTEYLPLTNPSVILHIWHSKQSAGSFSHDCSCVFAYELLYLSSNVQRKSIISVITTTQISKKVTLKRLKREQSLKDGSHVAWIAKILETCKTGTENGLESSTIFGSKRKVVFKIVFELLH